MAILEVKSLVKTYGRRRVVDGVGFEVQRGEIVGLLGPNGAGKTTSFRMTCGMIEPDQGQVFLNGKDVTQWPMFRRARDGGMGYLAQESSVFRQLSVRQNLLGMMELLGVTWRQRRARCLVSDPQIILLDEPFTGIDPVTIQSIQGIVRELRERGIAILITDHQVRETLQITDRSYVISKGQVLCHGTPREVVNHAEAREKYFGDFMDLRSQGPPPPHTPMNNDEHQPASR